MGEGKYTAELGHYREQALSQGRQRASRLEKAKRDPRRLQKATLLTSWFSLVRLTFRLTTYVTVH